MFWLNVKSRCLPRRVWAFIMKAKGRCAYDRRANQDGQKGEGRQSGGTCGAAWRCPPDSVQVGAGSFQKLKKLPKTHAYITSNMKIKDLLEVSLWLRTSLIPNAVITISLTSSCHIQVHRPLENMAECVEHCHAGTVRRI